LFLNLFNRKRFKEGISGKKAKEKEKLLACILKSVLKETSFERKSYPRLYKGKGDLN